MNPGRELDALVAEKVLGWKRFPLDPPECLEYSTDISAAWKVFEQFKLSQLVRAQLQRAFDEHVCHFWEYSNGDVRIHEGRSNSMPHAICLAALRAVGAIE